MGALATLPDEVAGLGCRRLAVVADEGVAAAGLLDALLATLDPDVIAAVLLVGPNPDVAQVERAAGTSRGAACDAVLAVGGGSALGAAKAVAVRLTNEGSIDTFEGLTRAPHQPAPTIAVPTTAGSGSEVSRVLVLHEPGRKGELVVRLEGVEPHIAILDGALLRGLPRAPMVYAGLDALSHSLESLWARRRTSITAALATAAATTILRCLPLVAEGCTTGANANGENDQLLQDLLEASCMANMACGSTGLTLVHALSGAPAVNLPHGMQNGILLPHVARFNATVSDPGTSVLVERIPQLYRDLAFKPVFPEGLTADQAVAMTTASKALGFRSNNRRECTDADLEEILLAAGAKQDG